MEKHSSPFEGAKEKLTRRGARLYLALYAILMLACLMLPWAISPYIGELIRMCAGWPLNGVADWVCRIAICVLLFVLVSLPAVGGSYFVSYRIGCEGEYEGKGLRYGAMLRMGLQMFARYWIPVLLLAVPYLLMKHLVHTDGGVWQILLQLAWMVLLFHAVALAFCYFLLAGRGFLTPFYMVRGNRAKDAKARSRMVMEHEKKAYYNYFMRFFGLLLLSFLSIGVLYVIDVFPRMMLTYDLLGEELDRRASQTEN